MKVYIAGPMTGIPKFNFPKFDFWASVFRDDGCEVFSPASHDRFLLGKPDDWIPTEEDMKGDWKEWAIPNAPTLRTMLGADLQWIAQNADTIYMLQGWENSKGAFAEWALARALGLQVIYEG